MALAAGLRIGSTLSGYLQLVATGSFCDGPEDPTWIMNICPWPMKKYHFAQELTKRRCDGRTIVILIRAGQCRDVGCLPSRCQDRAPSPPEIRICRKVP